MNFLQIDPGIAAAIEGTADGERHRRDKDCGPHLDADGTCAACGVVHGDPCDICNGRGFHTPTCPDNDEAVTP
jgi:hypothetical protein